jgi:translocation and assembly module TamA
LNGLLSCVIATKYKNYQGYRAALQVRQFSPILLCILIGYLCINTFPVSANQTLTPVPIELTFIPAIPNEINTNINISLSAINGLVQCSDISELAINQVQQAIGKTIIQSAHSFGYFAARVDTISLPEPQACHEWNVAINLGRQAQIADIALNITGELSESTELSLLTTQFKKKLNTPFQQAQYQGFKDNFYSQAIAQGYFDIHFQQQSVTVNADNQSVNIALQIALGERYTIRQFVIDESILEANVVATVSDISIGDNYSLNALNTLTNDLKQTGYFTSLQVRPDLKDRSNNQIDIEINGVEKAKHFVNFGIGISSDEGPRVSVDWRRPRINQSGHSLRASLKASLVEQSLVSTYKIPYGNPNTQYLALQSGLKHIDRNDSKSNTVTLGAQRFFDMEKRTGQRLLKSWQPSLFVRYEYNSFTQGSDDQINNQLLFVGGSITRLRIDHPLFPTTGDRQSLTLETAQSALGSDISISRVLSSSAWLRPIADLGWSVSKIKVDYLRTDSFAQTPSTLRFYSGGDQSVRGFGYEAISPVDSDNEDTGADSLVVLSQEFITPISESFRVAAFVDTAWAKSPDDETKAIGSGLGLHWQSPVGPIRVYLARGKNDAEMTWRLHLVMGPIL